MLTFGLVQFASVQSFIMYKHMMHDVKIATLTKQSLVCRVTCVLGSDNGVNIVSPGKTNFSRSGLPM